MALIERLIKDASEPESRWIPVHEFFAANVEVIRGKITVASVKTAYAMTDADIADYDALIALTPASNQIANRAIYLEGIHACFLLGEHRYPGYDTPALIRGKVGI